MPSAGRPQGGFSGRVALGSAGNGPGRSGLPVPEVQAALPPAQEGAAVEMLVLLSIAGRWFKPAGEPGASVQLSSLSAHLQEIEAGLDSEKAVDSKRVAEIKRSIADGKFEVNADKVADRLIEGTREFLRAHKQ